MKAWQRQIRERKEAERGDLLGNYWEGINTDIGRAEVREISRKMAEQIILEYEWLGTMPSSIWHCYGIFFDGICGGACVYGWEYSENLGVWDKYGFTGKLILLSRGACVHWAHPHAGSKLIRKSMDLLPQKYEVVTATTDEKAGEIGTIYQACGFDFVKMSNIGGRRSVIVNGKTITSRTLRKRLGGELTAERMAIFGGEVVKEHPKGRYFAFRGDKRTQRRNRKAIEHLIRPFPKRQSSEANAAPNAEARFDPALPLQIDGLAGT